MKGWPCLTRSWSAATNHCVSSAQSPHARVVLTREAGKNGKLQKALEQQGISVIELPLVETSLGPQRCDLNSECCQPHGATAIATPKVTCCVSVIYCRHELPAHLKACNYDWVVITSPEAANVFLQGWREAEKPQVLWCRKLVQTVLSTTSMLGAFAMHVWQTLLRMTALASTCILHNSLGKTHTCLKCMHEGWQVSRIQAKRNDVQVRIAVVGQGTGEVIQSQREDLLKIECIPTKVSLTSDLTCSSSQLLCICATHSHHSIVTRDVRQ